MPVDPAKFFQTVIERRISDAEKELDSIRTTIPPTEQGKGYLKALEGLFLTAKSNDDKYLYLSKVEKTPKNLRSIRKDLSAQTENMLHTEYDVGYFQALESYTRKLEESAPTDTEETSEKEKKD